MVAEPPTVEEKGENTSSTPLGSHLVLVEVTISLDPETSTRKRASSLPLDSGARLSGTPTASRILLWAVVRRPSHSVKSIWCVVSLISV